jgi:hypothetical protein
MTNLSEALTRLQATSQRESELIEEQQRSDLEKLRLALNTSQQSALASIKRDMERWESNAWWILRVPLWIALGASLLASVTIISAGSMMGSWARANYEEWTLNRSKLAGVLSALEQKHALLAATTWLDRTTGRTFVEIDPATTFHGNSKRWWAALAPTRARD